MIHLFKPYVPRGTFMAINEVIASGQLAQGGRVDRFEQDFESTFRVHHAVSLNSGTAALEMAYELIGLGAGDEVISTPLTCVATNLPLLRRGVKIVWADIKADTLCIDHQDVYRKITDKTKAIVQVHLGGIAAECDGFTVPVVSDACQALGVFTGDYTCCSFQAIKHITTGDGGMLVVNNEKECREAKLLRWFGIDRSQGRSLGWESYRTRMMCFDIDIPGTKRHMNDIAAAMGIVGLDHYDEVIEHRKKLFGIYRSRVRPGRIPGIELVDGKQNTYWLATFLVDRRDDFARMLFFEDVESNVVQVRNDTYKVFGGSRADLPVLNSIEHKYISLPIGMHVTEEDVNYICDKIEKGW